MKTHTIIILAALFFVISFVPLNSSAAEGDNALKIGTINLQKIISESKIGLEARDMLEKKVVEFRQKFQDQQEEIVALKNEIEKKSSVWSEDIRSEKEREYDKKLGVLKVESEVAQNEVKQLEKKLMEPVLARLNEVINDVGKRNGFSLILEYNPQTFRSISGVFYASETIEISDLVIKELDAQVSEK